MYTITLFGCGAVGSQLAMHLASPDITFILIDDDRIAENNIPTSAFVREQIGAYKTTALATLLYRKSESIAEVYSVTLTEANYRGCVYHTNLAIDCFDNAEARKITCKHLVPTLHVGVSKEGTGSITWDIHYQPFVGAPRGQDTFCTHLAGRGIIRFTADVAAHIVEQFIDHGIKESLTVTQRLTILR